MGPVDFGHKDDAGIGQRDGDVTVFSKKPAQCADMLFDPKRNSEGSVLDEFKQDVPCS